MARYARRPMRPNPLMPTLIAIAYLLFIQILKLWAIRNVSVAESQTLAARIWQTVDKRRPTRPA